MSQHDGTVVFLRGMEDFLFEACIGIFRLCMMESSFFFRLYIGVPLDIACVDL